MKVSVIVPCFRQAHFLEKCVASALAQDYRNVEVIVVDDGSPDDTAGVAAAFGRAVRYVRQENRGLASARNTGLRVATGEFVAFLDADDWFLPDTLARRVDVMRAVPNAAVSVSGWREVDAAGCSILAVRPAPLPGRDPFHALLRGNLAPPLCVMVRRAALAAVGPFTLAAPGCEDWDLWLRFAAAGYQFVRAPDSVAVYRVHGASMSKNIPAMYDSAVRVLRRHARRHPDCAVCRSAVAKSRRALWELYANFLSHRFATSHPARWEALGAAAQRALNEPGLGGLLLRVAFERGVIRVTRRVQDGGTVGGIGR